MKLVYCCLGFTGRGFRNFFGRDGFGCWSGGIVFCRFFLRLYVGWFRCFYFVGGVGRYFLSLGLIFILSFKV